MNGIDEQGARSEQQVEDECRTALDSIRRIVQLLRRTAPTGGAGAGLSAAQLFVLRKLADVQSLSVGELAGRTLTSQSSVSEVVQKLVTAGLVTRVRSPRDARSVELSLTEAGQNTLRLAPVAPQDYLIAGLKRMPPRDRRQLCRLLGRLVKETGMVDVTPRMLFDEESSAGMRQG
ncbi:MAG TPA: MarR family winged helix-turn-helix transcriptional regulator [Tepidisphaeraceae bacterium]|jgi:DNA-binding MarR family transcriptional regulator|nr:MarR family winged helix-turn-helix transcriptional regulator [Tepidisphaeraceae bacterium]